MPRKLEPWAADPPGMKGPTAGANRGGAELKVGMDAKETYARRGGRGK
jgi:hypothetical protein